MNVKKLTQMALLSAVALIIFVVEAHIPALVPFRVLNWVWQIS